jgi:hypothetical protein
MTTLSCADIRLACGIKNVVLPDHLHEENAYDKWGNIILPSGMRVKGELFHDEAVQKMLSAGRVLDLFVKYYKYPRTYHLPWSNASKDDRMLPDDSQFRGKRVIGTLKMDGEGTSMYRDHIHARSLDSGPHESRNWVKGLWGSINWMLGEDTRVCGENLYAVHSIRYGELPTYFMAFSVWEDNLCLSWDDTMLYLDMLGLQSVPIIYDGVYDADKIKEAFAPYEETNEGYVVRIADEFLYSDFRRSIAKFVRPKFKQMIKDSNGHWMSKKIETNKLKKQ